jgi:hypothetical protein
MRRGKLAVAMLTVLVAASCGKTSTKTVTVQTGSATGGPKSAPTRAQFIAQAEAICRADNAKLAPIKSHVEALKGSTLATRWKRGSALILEAVALERADIAQIRSLPEPSGDASTIAKLLTAAEEKETDESNLAHALANGLTNGELGAITAAGEAAKTAKAREHYLAQGYGIECGGSE